MSVTTEEHTEGAESERNVGQIVEIQGVVIEAVFHDKLPEINHAILVQRPEAARAEEDEDIAATTVSARSRWTRPTASRAASR